MLGQEDQQGPTFVVRTTETCWSLVIRHSSFSTGYFVIRHSSFLTSPSAVTVALAALLLRGGSSAGAPASDLAAQIDRILAHKALRKATVGVCVVELESGKQIYARNADAALILASNTKIFTTAAALFHLGHDFRFCTMILRGGPLNEQGAVEGDLIVRGDGDPNVSGRFRNDRATAVFEELADTLKEVGIRKVTGDVVSDDSIFDRDYLRPGASWYVSPVSGLPFNDNCIDVIVEPGPAPGKPAAVRTEPETQYVTVDNRIQTRASRRKDKALFRVQPGSNVIEGSGTVYLKAPQRRYRIGLGDPSLYFVVVLTETLRNAGIEVRGRPRLLRPGEAHVNATAVVKMSSGLDRTLRVANKESDNFYAECLFKRMGAKAAGQGTFASGAAAIGQFLQSIGVDPKTCRFSDGCGLSRDNVASARVVTLVLRHVMLSSAGQVFRDSLAVAGVDGTLERRLTEPAYKGKVQAKTGYIKRVSALSGYAQSTAGKRYVFSMLFNGFSTRNATMKAIQDSICRALVDN